MFLGGFAVDGLLVFFDFVNDVLVAFTDAVLAETPESVVPLLGRLREARVSN